MLEAMAAIAPPGVGVGCRSIRDGDEAHLLPEEAGSIPARRPAMRRASGARALDRTQSVVEYRHQRFPGLALTFRRSSLA